MPKRCNVLLETVKELPPLQVLEIKGGGLCHGRTVSRRLWSGLYFCHGVAPCRSELARDEPESAAGYQVAGVIVNDHREQSSVDRLLLQGAVFRCATLVQGPPGSLSS